MRTAPPPINPTGLIAYGPAEVARRIEDAGIAKAMLGAPQLATLSLLAGAFIGLGAAAYTAVMAGVDPAFGPYRFLGGIVFSLGLVLVIVAGAELFTGNALIVMACVDRRISLFSLLRNWAFTLTGNALGALAMVGLMVGSGLLKGAVADVVVRVAEAKTSLGWLEALSRGILCNMLVCLAVWLTFAARDVTGKILAILLPISAFVLLGFEHSIANFYLIPAGWVAGAKIGWSGFLGNLIPVTIGNVIGGAGGVALAYRMAYRPAG
ncbi:MAG: formate/nitrite transporter family protein [Hyphomicrobiales bacterium]